jgi:hypothetical protein
MKNKCLFIAFYSATSFLLFALFCGSTQKIDGPPAGFSGGFGEPACNRCHVGPNINSGPASLNLKFGNEESTYEPNKTYAIEITVSGSDRQNHGFQLVAKNANNQPIGKFAVIDQVLTELNPQDANYIQHTRVGQVGRSSWRVGWTAPATEAGPVTFYLAVVAANGDVRATGDLVYTFNKTITPSTAGGLVNNIEQPSFAVFPNPAKNKLYVKSLEVEKQQYTIRLFDMNGKLVHSLQKSFSTEMKTLSIDLEGLAPGLYGLEIIGKPKSFRQTIIVE